MSSISSDFTLQLALRIGVAAALLTLLIALLILVLRLRRHWRDRREQRFQRQWRPLLMRAVAGETPTGLPPLAKRDQWRFLRLWNHLQESVRGEANLRLAAVARQLGGARLARQLLARRGLRHRLFGIMTLGHLRDHTAWNLLQAQLQGRDRLCALFAARALILIDAPRGVHAVLPPLLQRDDWEMVRIATLLQEFREALGRELAINLSTLPVDRLPRAMQLAEVLHLHVPDEVLLPWLHASQPAELLVVALRVCSGAAVLPAVRALAGHEDWRVRVQAARALGRLGDPSDVALLARLLGDAQWWVRYRAAGALAQLPRLQHETLRGLLDGLQDPYAREIFTHALAEQRGAGT